MSPSACFSNNHYAGTGSPPSELHISRSVTTTNSDSTVDSPTSAAASSNPSIDSLASLQLFVDLSSYPLQQLSNSYSSEPRSAARQYPMVLRPQLLKTALLTAFTATSVAPNCRVMSSFACEPLAFSDADRYEAWHGAMCNEIQVICSNKTWSLVPFHPSMNVVGCQWVYKIKRRMDSSVKRYKAHLVAIYFTQQETIDYSETFIPVVKQTAVRLVFSIAIYMKQPSYFVNFAFPFHMCWLHKSLYGLKQAPRAWCTRLSDFLIYIVFHASKVDTFLFILSSGVDIFYLLVYINDILLMDNNSAILPYLIQLLSSEFKVRDLGVVHYFLTLRFSPLL